MKDLIIKSAFMRLSHSDETLRLIRTSVVLDCPITSKRLLTNIATTRLEQKRRRRLALSSRRGDTKTTQKILHINTTSHLDTRDPTNKQI